MGKVSSVATVEYSKIVRCTLDDLRKILRWTKNLGFSVVRICKAFLQRTDYARWQKNISYVPDWDERNVIIARHIPTGSTVLDLGAGAQTLRRYLKAGCLYVPCDLIKSSPDCLVCDFNDGDYPQIARQYDFSVCSGLFEYVREPLKFLRCIKSYAGTVMFSYCPWGGRKIERITRLEQGWINHLTMEQLEELFRQAGYTWQRIGEWQDHLIYQLHPD